MDSQLRNAMQNSPVCGSSLFLKNASFQNTYMLFVEIKYCTRPLFIRHNKLIFVTVYHVYMTLCVCHAVHDVLQWLTDEWLSWILFRNQEGETHCPCFPLDVHITAKMYFLDFFLVWTTTSIHRVQNHLIVCVLPATPSIV